MTESSLLNNPYLPYPLFPQYSNLDKDRQSQKHQYSPERHRRVRDPVTFTRCQRNPIPNLGARIRLRVRGRSRGSTSAGNTCNPIITIIDSTVAEVPDRTTGHAASVVESTVLGISAAPAGFADGVA